VLTAHPTEVQRKSILDCEREIVRLLQWRDRSALTPDELATMQTGLYRQVLTLWQTAMLRLTKLQVKDEIDNHIAYYRYTFLDEIPRHADLEACATQGTGRSFPRFWSWARGSAAIATAIIVGADTLQYANRVQATVALAHHLDKCISSAPSFRSPPRLVTPRRTARARRGGARPQSAPWRRAVSAGARRQLRAPRGDRHGADRLRAAPAAARGDAAVRHAGELIADLG
jgi:phosphoenolpyruvate carboxylase